MPFPLQIRRYATALTRHFGLVGHVGPTLIEDVQPTMDLVDPPPEVLHVAGIRRLVGGAGVGPVVGQFSSVALVNPPDARAIVVVEGFTISQAPPPDVRFGLVGDVLTNYPRGGADQVSARDSRNQSLATGAAQRAVCYIGTLSSAVRRLGTLLNPFRQSATGPTSGGPVMPYVLHPGWAFVVETNAVNTILGVYFFAKEYDAAPQETEPLT